MTEPEQNTGQHVKTEIFSKQKPGKAALLTGPR